MDQKPQPNTAVIMAAMFMGAVITLVVLGYMAFVEKQPYLDVAFFVVLIGEGVALIVMRSVLSKRINQGEGQ